MPDTQPPNKDQTQQRLIRLENTVDVLHRHLLSSLELSYALAVELAQAAGRKQSEDPICTKLSAEFNLLSTLKPTAQKPLR